MKKRIVGLALAATALGLAACGGAINTQSKPPANQVQGDTGSTAAPPPDVTTTTAPPALHVGEADDFTGTNGTGLEVTMAQVIDPASGSNQYETPTSGDRFVAVQVSFKNNGTVTYSSDVNSQVTLVGSDSQVYSASFQQIQNCTNFSSGEYTVAPGDNLTGCVAFEVPNGVTLPSVKFTPSLGSSVVGTWLNP